MGQVRKIRIYFEICGILAVFLGTLWCLCPVNLYAAEKDSVEKSDEIKAYEEFLDGKQRVFFEIGMKDLFYDADFLTVEMLKNGALLEDILKQVNECFCCDGKMGILAYAYIDCCKDGKKELAVRFGDLRPRVDYDEWFFIIVYENERLFLRYAFESYARDNADLYAYGSIVRSGSSGAACSTYEEQFLNANGRVCPVYSATLNYGDAANAGIEEKIFDKEELFICTWRYTIEDQDFEILEPSGEVDPKQWEKFCTLYEQGYGRLYTKEEIDRFIQKRRKEAGIREEWIENKKPDWKLLENKSYRKYVKEIELVELRKERYARDNSSLKEKWVTCNVEKDYETAIINMDCYGVNFLYRNAIEYAVADYSKKADIPRDTWTITEMVSYGHGLFAVSLESSQLEKKREISLLFDNDALKMGIEKYSQYIVVVDFQHSTEGRIPWNGFSYDSMLDWESYADSAAGKKEYSYTIYRSKEDFFENTSSGERALNWYLKNMDADKSGVWELDLNASCSIKNGYISILRFTCKNQEVIIALDENNETYAVIKGLDVK